MTTQTRVLTSAERANYIVKYNNFRNSVRRNLQDFNRFENNVLPAVSSLVKTIAVGAIVIVGVLFAYGFKTLATSIFIVSVTVIGLLTLGVRLGYGYIHIARVIQKSPRIAQP